MIGDVAVEAGKVEGLLAAGAEVTVIAKGPEAAWAGWRPTRGSRSTAATAARPTSPCRAVRGPPPNRAGATPSPPTLGRRVLVNVMDDVPNCDFAALGDRPPGDLVIAIGTGGRAPAASRLRASSASGSGRTGPRWWRGPVRADTSPPRRGPVRRWKAALDLDELEGLIAAGRSELAATRLRGRLLEGVAQGCGQSRAPTAGFGCSPAGEPAPASRVQARPGAP